MATYESIENLSCSICTNLLSEPTRLSCEHTICKKCLDECRAKQGSSKRISCPICRRVTKLKVDGHTPKVTVNGRVAAESRPLVIAKDIDLPAGMRGMDKLSEDTVVVGYGSSQAGAESFTSEGVRHPFLGENVGSVRDIAILSNKHSVASHGKELIKLYNDVGNPTGIEFKSGILKCDNYKVFCDKNDKIYVVNCSKNIYIFNSCEDTPQKVLRTGRDHKQICATSSGTIITTSSSLPNVLTVFDQDGIEGSAIPTRGDDERLYAGVDCEDRVFIASIKVRTGVFRLSRYILEGKRLMEEVQYTELQLAPSQMSWCYLICLNQNLLAFATMAGKLYFIEIPQT